MGLSTLVFACILILPGALLAQIGTEGSFIGTVKDPSGAVVPGATIHITNLETGLRQSVASDQEGNFSLLSLPVGPYSVSVAATGFKGWLLPRTVLSVGDRNRISPVLEVGQVTEVVEVGAATELLQTERGAISTVVEMQSIRELPLATRNPLHLVSIAPGMRVASTQTGGERATFIQGQAMRSNKANFTLDGLNSNAPMDEGGTGIPNVDTMSEFNVQTNSFSAEQGRHPIQVQVVTKSGSNAFHGAVWEFFQNDKLNARNAFASSRPQVRRNQFGTAIGGPVIRNRTFFFTSFEGTIVRNAQIYNSLGVTPAMKSGDFSDVPRVIRNPFDNGHPFPSNKIPASMISSPSRYFLPLILESNSPDGFFRANASEQNDTYEGTARIDHQITAAQRIYGRFVIVRQPGTRLGYRPDPDITGDNLVRQNSFALNYTWAISPELLLTASAGVLRTNESYSNPSLGIQNDVLLAGIQGIPTEGREAFVGPPNLSFANGYTGVSFPADSACLVLCGATLAMAKLRSITSGTPTPLPPASSTSTFTTLDPMAPMQLVAPSTSLTFTQTTGLLTTSSD